ncbi:transposase [Dubosiella newyorkensis]
MENLYAVCCGIDVHKKLIVACLRQGNDTQIREFGASTRELLELADWLVDHHCQAAAMESTGSYWKPLYNILESQNLNPIVVNAQHMHNVPGRKTDIKDAEWISDLLCHGLLTPSFIPKRAQRELRELVGYRKSLAFSINGASLKPLKIQVVECHKENNLNSRMRRNEKWQNNMTKNLRNR